jgi:hypothetical protein
MSSDDNDAEVQSAQQNAHYFINNYDIKIPIFNIL